MPFSAWLVDPVPKWVAAPAVLVLLLTWGALTWWTHRRARSRGVTVASGLTLLGLSALVGSFALLLLFGTRVDATPVHEGDNQGTLIDIAATYETPNGETVLLRDATPVLHVSYPANSAEQVVTFMVLEPFPRFTSTGTAPCWRTGGWSQRSSSWRRWPCGCETGRARCRLPPCRASPPC
ncbi:MAG: hypothetical protein IPG81_28360 [Sandaracinaceae bacterium]|nr:hypothetical protein [Sandaracinaceae bacterium]